MSSGSQFIPGLLKVGGFSRVDFGRVFVAILYLLNEILLIIRRGVI